MIILDQLYDQLDLFLGFRFSPAIIFRERKKLYFPLALQVCFFHDVVEDLYSMHELQRGVS